LAAIEALMDLACGRRKTTYRWFGCRKISKRRATDALPMAASARVRRVPSWWARASFGRLVGSLLGLAIAALEPALVRAAELLPAPTGAVLLTVSGRIERANEASTARLDLSMLTQLGVKSIRTSTPWTDGVHAFEGVLASDLLTLVGAAGAWVRARGLNDFYADIPYSDFTRYGVLIAYKMDGEPLKIRDGGPLWIIYPRDDLAEVRGPIIRERSVWQLVALDVR
jgi:hypothetical protein